MLIAATPVVSAQEKEDEAAQFQVAKQKHEVYCAGQFTSRPSSLEFLRGKVPLQEMGEPTDEMKALRRLPNRAERVALRAYYAAYLACMRDLTQNVLKRPAPQADTVNDPGFEPLGMIALLRDGKISFADFNVRLAQFWELTRSPPAQAEGK